VNASNNADYIKAFDRFYGIVQTDLVAKGRDAKVVWPPNSDDHNGIPATQSWPGDQFVDVVGVDYYDWDRATDQTKWDAAFNKTGTYGGPAGIGAWQAFAKQHGKPISLPEWGTDGEGPTDDPFFIQKMNEFFRANAGTGPGQVWYEIYFDCTGYVKAGGETFLIFPEADSKVPQSAAMYKSLKWGDGGVTGVSPAPAVSSGVVAPITPSFFPLAPCPTCTTEAITPMVSGSVEPTSSQVNPSDIVENPSIDPNAPESISQTPGQEGNGGHGGGNQGLFQLILQFIMQLITLLLSLLGIK
jgi:hypothetical protein